MSYTVLWKRPDQQVTILHHSAGMDAYTIHGLISRYLDNVFPVDTMYDYFLAIMKYIFDKNENKEQEYICMSQELNKLARDKQIC